MGRWDWYPPEPAREFEPIQADSGSECEFGQGLDGLPVHQGTIDRPFWSEWAADAVGPVSTLGEWLQRSIE